MSGNYRLFVSEQLIANHLQISNIIQMSKFRSLEGAECLSTDHHQMILSAIPGAAQLWLIVLQLGSTMSNQLVGYRHSSVRNIVRSCTKILKWMLCSKNACARLNAQCIKV